MAKFPLGQARIGYAGYRADWTPPGDRRRFVAYARQRGLEIEPAHPDRQYDVVVVTCNGDLPAWVRRKRRQPGLRLVFELIDSYMIPRGLVHDIAKGIARFAMGVDGLSRFHYGHMLAVMCHAADAVICSTSEQAAAIAPYNANVHTSFDFFDADIHARKVEFEVRPPVRLVWEGQANTLPNLLSLAETLNAMGDAIELHVVTDAVRFRYFGRFGPIRSSATLAELACPVILHPWDRETFADDVVAADIAIIPIDLDDPFATGKPENKLVMLWKMGMPVITAATPAYTRVMTHAGLGGFVARTPDDWREQIGALAALDAGSRAAMAGRGTVFAAEHYSQDAFAGRFDAVFRSIGYEV